MDQHEWRAFISHSWEDKSAVRLLAAQLQANGVNVWFDEWEISPGDSLVQKLNEGLEACDAFIVVISQNSIASKWVQEELSAAVVRRIESKSRLIPVRLDDTQLPAVIGHLVYVPFYPLDEAVSKLLKAIFGVNDKPPIGPIPVALQQSLTRQSRTIRTLSPEASEVVRHLTLKVGLNVHVSAYDLANATQLNPMELNDAVDLLRSRGLIKTFNESGWEPYTFGSVTPRARAWLYLSKEELGYSLEQDMLAVAQCAVNHGRIDAATLEDETQLSPERLNLAVLALGDSHLIKLFDRVNNGPYSFLDVSATRQTREWIRQREA